MYFLRRGHASGAMREVKATDVRCCTDGLVAMSQVLYRVLVSPLH